MNFVKKSIYNLRIGDILYNQQAFISPRLRNLIDSNKIKNLHPYTGKPIEYPKNNMYVIGNIIRADNKSYFTAYELNDELRVKYKGNYGFIPKNKQLIISQFDADYNHGFWRLTYELELLKNVNLLNTFHKVNLNNITDKQFSYEKLIY